MSGKVLSQLMDRRDSSRLASHKLLPLCIASAEDNMWMSSQLADVSREGLGILTTTHLPTGTKLKLHMLKCDLDFEVAWCRSTDNGDYFCGLLLKTPNVNLESLFSGILTGSLEAS